MYWQKMGFGSFQVKLVARLTNKVFLIINKMAKRDKSLSSQVSAHRMGGLDHSVLYGKTVLGLSYWFSWSPSWCYRPRTSRRPSSSPPISSSSSPRCSPEKVGRDAEQELGDDAVQVQLRVLLHRGQAPGDDKMQNCHWTVKRNIPTSTISSFVEFFAGEKQITPSLLTIAIIINGLLEYLHPRGEYCPSSKEYCISRKRLC